MRKIKLNCIILYFTIFSLNIFNYGSAEAKLQRLLYCPDAGGKSAINYITINEKELKAVEDSPFNCYSLSMGFPQFKYPSPNTISLIKKSRKKFWPRVLFPFYLINWQTKKLDLWDSMRINAALSNVKEALELAKSTGVEGIFIDSELYSYRNGYSLTKLSEENRRTPEEVINRLKEIGIQFADITQEVYSNRKAVLWFPFADLNWKCKDNYKRNVNYFIEGVLDRIKEKNYNIDIIEGGEISIGWGQTGIKRLNSKMERQAASLQEYVQKYYPHFKLGGVFTLWYDTNILGGYTKWLNSIPDNLKEIKKLEDYPPLLKEMFNHYEYVWVYWNNGRPPYLNDFDPVNAQKYREVIRKALPAGYKENY